MFDDPVSFAADPNHEVQSDARKKRLATMLDLIDAGVVDTRRFCDLSL